MSEDDSYLHDLAQATQMKVGSLSQQLSAPGDNREKLFARLLDPGKRSDLRMQKFGDFVHPRDRHTLDVPREIIQDFEQNKTKKFTCLFDLYLAEARKPGNQNDHLLEVLELFLADLMDCFDHPREVVGWNPFAALADLIEVGALVRTPTVVQSCSRLTLGADWSLLSDADEARIGDNLMKRLHRLHQSRMVQVMDILGRWAGKFPKESTCTTCGTDPWELFLLTTVVSMVRFGTRYIDKDSASDTSSDHAGGREVDAMDLGGGDDDDDERDDHRGRGSDSEEEMEDDTAMDVDRIDPRLHHLNDDDEPQPRRASTTGLGLSQRLMKNFGPNEYLFRLVSMELFGAGDASRNTLFKVCPRCGFRFDGKDPKESSRVYLSLQHAVDVARQEIASVQEVIDLPTS